MIFSFISFMDFSFLPVYALLLSVVVGFGSLFGFLRIFWKDIKSEFKELKLELKSEIQEVRSEAKTESQSLRTEMVQLHSEIHELRSEFKSDIQRVDKNVFYLRKRMDVLVDSFALRFLSADSFGKTSPKQI
ncbi:Conserved hypothetical protein [Leptospira borgpetersenii serovar Hardjo-bovis str. L550]|uniref:DUF1640 domain-containing protein n=2 Tax=Leptospira borgpetersenii serovar Hardjo-bovis TaxID=338217 RepID=Q04SP0_LEPBJ|nr:Conserved hypothetical protein [Leptospira borgpetersenii serovar Hardjo-bovis str. JB197]ABJ79181.1 Conserved hypothetical protein [Leptospira borgpetersenii serovar Hardjo-bovis str. L550]